MTEPDPFESDLRSYLRERSLQAGDSSIADRLVDRVIGGERRRPRFRVLASVAIALAVVLLVGTPTTVILLKRSSHVSAPPPAKILPPSSSSPATPSPSPTPSSTPLVTVEGVAFTDATHGWAVGSSCVWSANRCDVVVDRSSDGGVSWSPAVTLAQLAENPATNYSGSIGIHARGSNVWVAAAAAGIFESHDAGTTWVNAYSSSPVGPIAVGATTVWALAGCYANGTGCTLYDSPVGSDSWTQSPSQPPSGPTGGPSDLDVAPNGAVLVVGSAHPPTDPIPLLLTVDGGRSWVRSQLPCSLGVLSVQSLDGKTIWELCSQDAGMHQGPTAIYVSGDAGATWQARVNDTATPPVGNLQLGNLASSLALTQNSAAFIGVDGGIMRSVDGGRTWNQVYSDRSCILDSGVMGFWFLPSGNGWALRGPGLEPQCPLLLRTTDGGATWQAAGAPLGWTANQTK